jgi:hypothetical protein
MNPTQEGTIKIRLSLGDLLFSRIAVAGERSPLHDRGKVLVQGMFMLAGGGESCADIEYLRDEFELGREPPSAEDQATRRRGTAERVAA